MGPSSLWKARLSSLATFSALRARMVAARGASFNNASSIINTRPQQPHERYKQNQQGVVEEYKGEGSSDHTSKVSSTFILTDNTTTVDDDFCFSGFDEVKVFSYVALVDNDFTLLE